ncbi:MAG TPA: phosphoribosylanthranilate isomerase [Vicinamibacteria bacterium]
MAGRVFVKVCGITSAADGALCAAAGADAVGFVFWPMSSRRIDADKAAAICRGLPPFLLRVGVFVDAPAAEMARVADLVGLDLLQLHGDEAPEALAGRARRAIKAVRVGKGFTAAEALRYDKAAGLLVDTRLPGETMMPGGTGVPFDWTLVRGVRERASFLMLAGGLSPDNVAEALEAVRPDAVDVSSGVESLPGRKDPEKVRAFVRTVREWERAQ